MTEEIEKLADRLERVLRVMKTASRERVNMAVWDEDVAAVEASVSALRAAASPSQSVDREVSKFLRAVADGFTGKIEHGYLCVENPDATPQSLAVGGDDPNLVVSADAIIALFSAPDSLEPATHNCLIAGSSATDDRILTLENAIKRELSRLEDIHPKKFLDRSMSADAQLWQRLSAALSAPVAQACNHPIDARVGSGSVNADGSGHSKWTCQKCGHHEHIDYPPKTPAEKSATGSPELDVLLKRATDAFHALTPEQQEDMLRKQRESWVRGEMELAKYERGERCAPDAMEKVAGSNPASGTKFERFSNDEAARLPDGLSAPLSIKSTYELIEEQSRAPAALTAEEVRERAAQVAEGRAPATQDMTSTHVADACFDIATAIRSLPLTKAEEAAQ